MKNMKIRQVIALICSVLAVIGLAIFITRSGYVDAQQPIPEACSSVAIDPEVPPVEDASEYEPQPEYDFEHKETSDVEAEPIAEEIPVPMPEPAYLTAMNGALGWLHESNPSPRVGSVGGEWSVLATARAGLGDAVWFGQYLEALDLALAGEGGRVERMTDYARVTLALTALGLDASIYNGRDLTAALHTFVPHEDRPPYNRTINADIFALIALDSRPYGGDREQYIAAILTAEVPGGGWGLTGGVMPDITAMAIAALAPYHDSSVEVRAAINRALELFGERPMRDAEGNAQMIVALAALGRDAEIHLSALLTFHDPETGAFMRNGEPNMMSTEQAAYALVAYHRFATGQNRLYDMHDVFNDDG
ncbi:MAG: hypothetical protein FWE19_05275 [Oscillospiraceae bacterium]|nr:hypothetical protein [Oscillospiraceae bacterium]